MLDATLKFFQVIMIDLVMSGDNAIVIGLAVAGLAATDRKRIIAAGIAAATVLRILLALIAVPLLKIIGLTLAGGILLTWVAWELWRELRKEEESQPSLTQKQSIQKTKLHALGQIVLADLSMSLDNVLAVAGSAREHPIILVFGLAISILLMALASTYIAKLIEKHRWISYAGLLMIVYVALEMIVSGAEEVAHVVL